MNVRMKTSNLTASHSTGRRDIRSDESGVARGSKGSRAVRNLLVGYLTLGRLLAGLAAIVVGAALAATVLVLPLYALSVNFPHIYALGVAVAIGFAVIGTFVRRRRSSEPVSTRSRARAKARTVLTVAGVVLGAYLIAVLAAAHLLIPAVLLSILYLGAIGCAVGSSRTEE